MGKLKPEILKPIQIHTSERSIICRTRYTMNSVLPPIKTKNGKGSITKQILDQEEKRIQRTLLPTRQSPTTLNVANENEFSLQMPSQIESSKTETNNETRIQQIPQIISSYNLLNNITTEETELTTEIESRSTHDFQKFSTTKIKEQNHDCNNSCSKTNEDRQNKKDIDNAANGCSSLLNGITKEKEFQFSTNPAQLHAYNAIFQDCSTEHNAHTMNQVEKICQILLSRASLLKKCVV